MEESLDRQLCEKYPKIFRARDRRSSMRQTAMSWGISVGDGWYNILNSLCGVIQHHINSTRKSRADDLKFNRALARALSGDKNGLMHYYAYADASPDYWVQRTVANRIETAAFRQIPEACPQVIALQIKEKFSGLRFYYQGGDETVRGMVELAEAMSYVTCEECGSPGRSSNDGWIRVLCDTHKVKFDMDRKAMFDDTPNNLGEC